jgi:hypothetical protein
VRSGDLPEAARVGSSGLTWCPMVNGILLALLAALSYGFLGVSFELAAKRGYPIWNFILFKQFVGFSLGIGVSLYLGLPLFRPDLFLLGFIGAVSYVLTCASYLLASRERNIAANWTILNLSVLLPLLVSIIWFGDKLTVAKTGGVVATMASILLIGEGHGATTTKGSSRWLRYILLAFLLNGILAMLFRWVPDGLGALFTAYFYGISCLLVLPYKLARDRSWKLEPGLTPIGVMAACSHWLGIMLTIAALHVVGRVSHQSGVIVYPITNGLVIPVGVILGVLILKQKVDTRSRWGVVAGMAGLVLLFLPNF